MTTATDLRASAAEHYAARQESIDRCDTDGFVSQWAHGILGKRDRAQARIVEAGGTATFPGLYRRSDGARLRAKLISYHCSFSHRTKWAWSFRDQDGGVDRSQPLVNDTRSKRGKLWKLGFEVRDETAPAKAIITGTGTGLSGHAWVEVIRTDGGYPADATSP